MLTLYFRALDARRRRRRAPAILFPCSGHLYDTAGRGEKGRCRQKDGRIYSFTTASGRVVDIGRDDGAKAKPPLASPTQAYATSHSTVAVIGAGAALYCGNERQDRAASSS